MLLVEVAALLVMLNVMMLLVCFSCVARADGPSDEGPATVVAKAMMAKQEEKIAKLEDEMKQKDHGEPQIAVGLLHLGFEVRCGSRGSGGG